MLRLSTIIFTIMTYNLPYTFATFAINWLTDRYSLVFSNLNASKKAYKINGK